jgi:hypothetical protein
MHARMILAAILTMAGCTGAIGGSGPKPAGGGPSTPPSGSGSPGPGSPSVPGGGPGTSTPGATLPPIGADPLEPDRRNPACKDIDPGPAPLRRLTRTEFDNTVRDLLGEDLGLGKTFPAEELQHSFDNSADLRSVSDVLAENYHNAAKEIGKRVVGKLGSFLPCDPGKDGGEAACLDRFLDGFGRRIWRRPLDQEEKTDLKQVFAAGRMTTFAEGIDAVVRVMLLAPQFMYRLEQGVPVPGASYERPGHWDMASRLSYLLWGTMPDAELFTAAEGGKLGTRAEVAAQARRMIDDPRAAAMVTNFAGQWLQLRELADAAKEPTLYPAWKDEYLPLFRQETEEFLTSVWKADAKLDTLLSAPYTLVNGPLAGFYGMKGVTGDSFQKVQLDAGQRAGMLTHASLLAAKSGPDQSSPILRGVFIREQMFCQPLPQPPVTVDANPPELSATLTTKERFAAHRNDPSCEGCHRLIDPIGFGFERYDATGAYRTMENGKVVDATGELAGTDVDGPFTGAIELGKKLVQSQTVEACVASHWFNFALGREPSDADACTTHSLKAAFAGSGGDLRQLLLATVQTDAFLFKGGSR